MTNKEAHSYLEDLQRKYTRDRYLYKSEFIEANGLAILSLEKQIPRTPIVDIYGDLDCMCPTCHRVFKKLRKGKMSAHCPDCGQKLDWVKYV